MHDGVLSLLPKLRSCKHTADKHHANRPGSWQAYGIGSIIIGHKLVSTAFSKQNMGVEPSEQAGQTWSVQLMGNKHRRSMSSAAMTSAKLPRNESCATALDRSVCVCLLVCLGSSVSGSAAPASADSSSPWMPDRSTYIFTIQTVRFEYGSAITTPGHAAAAAHNLRKRDRALQWLQPCTLRASASIKAMQVGGVTEDRHTEVLSRLSLDHFWERLCDHCCCVRIPYPRASSAQKPQSGTMMPVDDQSCALSKPGKIRIK